MSLPDIFRLRGVATRPRTWVGRISDVLRAPLGWTLHGAIQPHVDIYLSEETFEAVKIAFPYLVQKEFASGGGDVR